MKTNVCKSCVLAVDTFMEMSDEKAVELFDANMMSDVHWHVHSDVIDFMDGRYQSPTVVKKPTHLKAKLGLSS